MKVNRSFAAPWGALLKAMTLGSSGLLLGMFYIGISFGPDGSLIWNSVMIVLPIVMLVVASFFTIRGYELYNDCILVKRVGWYSRIDLAGLREAVADPEAMAKSIRTFGNGGMFCFSGFFRNKRLGRYRTFATDFRRAVVLRFSSRTVVVTPDDPEAFVAALEKISEIPPQRP